MAESAPIRPQRIIRANRETTGGLLMSVIRSLTTSRDSADRDRERLELEKGFQQCDTKLNDLISQHGNDLYKVMTIFSTILTNLSRARERLIDTRDKLLNCQKLLHCKREELKKLWLEIIENRAVFNLLEKIERISALPKQVESYAEKKHYLHAGQCCIDGLRQLGISQSSLVPMSGFDPLSASSSASIQSPNIMGLDQSDFSLGKIEALAEIKQELLAKKEMLFDKCIEELHRHLYTITAENIRKQYQNEHQQQRQQQVNRTIQSNNDMSNKRSVIYDNLRLYDSQMKNDSQKLSSQLSNKNENDFDAYPEEDSRQFISMLTKCIGLLNKIPDAIKIIKERFDEEFVNVVIRTAQDILSENSNDFNDDNLTSSANINPISLMDLDADGIPDVSAINQSTASSSATPRTGENLVVLTCTRLLGYRYDGFSHLKAINHNIDNENSVTTINQLQSQWPRTSIQLKQLFDMLIRQFYHIMELHDEVVLINLKRIESALNMAAMADNMNNDYQDDFDSNQIDKTSVFYSSTDIWTKIQLLIQQLLDYYLDISQISGQASSTGPIGNAMNYNLVQSFLPSAAVNMLFGLSNTNSTNSSVSGNAGCPENYSSFFSKRRPMVVAGAMNAVNVMMSKNTSNTNVISGSGGTAAMTTNDQTDQSNMSANVSSSGTTNPTGTLHTVSSGHNLLHTFSPNNWRTNQSNLFKFDHSTQAISWNSFLQQQQRQTESMNDNNNEKQMENNSASANDQSSDMNKLSNNQQQSSSIMNNINNRLFDSLRSICGQSPDNLVLIYDTLLEHVHKCPIKMKNIDAKNQQQINTLQSYLMNSSEKFTQHINSQLDAMLEQAQKSLESGVTILLQKKQPNQTKDQSQKKNVANHKMIGPSSSSSDNSKIDNNNQQSPASGPSVSIGSGNDITLLLLESAVLVDVAVYDLSMLMIAMSEYRQHYLGYICNVLTAYKDTCTRLYDTVTTEIMQPSGSTLTINQSIMSGISNLDLTESNQSSTMLTNADQRRSILSAYWARNEDVNRLLKSQPNWIQLEIAIQQSRSGAASSLSSLHSHHRHANNAPSRRQMMIINRQLSTSMSFDVESPEDIRERTASEIDILLKLLSQEITQSELIWNPGQLTLLANMQQSFEWLAARCDHLVQMIQSNQFEQQNSKTEQPSSNRRNRKNSSNDSSDVIIATLNQLIVDFEEFGQLCLMVLHLEIRVHCCYHLQALDAQFFTTPAPSMMIQTSDYGSNARSIHLSNHTSTDLSDDGRIMPLLEDLQRMYTEISAAQLSPAKMGYIFEGLGHLIASKFINSAMSVKRVKLNGIKRACRAIYDIQRRLSTLTKSRELALDHARQYFEMLLLTPEEIFSSIIERGRQFKPQEYISAITLLHQSGLCQTGVDSSSSTTPATMLNNTATTTSVASNSIDQHQSNLQLQKLLNRLNHILAEVIS